MQNQENMHETFNQGQQTYNTDPREQSYVGNPDSQEQDYASSSYEEGYSGLSFGDTWRESDKLRPESGNQRHTNGLVAIIAVLCAVILAESLLGGPLGWINWVIIAVIVSIGSAAIATNWHVVTIPMPTRTFQVNEQARLIINNSSGSVEIRRGEQNLVSIDATKRASGLGVNPEQIQITTEQIENTIRLATTPNWSLFQFGLRSVNFVITVPEHCDVQLSNGSGTVLLQGTTGNMQIQTGSGRIEASELQGQIALKTGSGRIQAGSIQGQLLAKTGSGRIFLQDLRGTATATTGSGRIEIEQSMLKGISHFKTGSGRIAFDGVIDPHSNIEMRSGSGSIQLRLPSNTAFSLDARTGSGGVHNDFGASEVGSGPRGRLRLRTGSGGIRIQNSNMLD